MLAFCRESACPLCLQRLDSRHTQPNPQTVLTPNTTTQSFPSSKRHARRGNVFTGHETTVWRAA